MTTTTARTETTFFPAFGSVAARTRVVELSPAAWRLASSLRGAGFRLAAGVTYARTVDVVFDSGGDDCDTRFGVVTVSALSGKVLRTVVERFGPGDRVVTERHEGYRDSAAAVRRLVT